MSRAPSKDVHWREEWVPLARIVKHQPLQVRRALDERAVKRYGEMTRAGQEPPPIRVGHVKGTYYLVDGWHRMEAGALVTMEDVAEGVQVRVELADLTMKQAIWQAAKANMAHGVPLKGRELREVFRAFVKAGEHRAPDGGFLSYRDIERAIGKGHTTIRNWMQKDFPSVFAAISGGENGNAEAGPAEVERWDPAREHLQTAQEAVQTIAGGLAAMTPEGRWEVLQWLDKLRQDATALGVQEPEPEPF